MFTETLSVMLVAITDFIGNSNGEPYVLRSPTMAGLSTPARQWQDGHLWCSTTSNYEQTEIFFLYRPYWWVSQRGNTSEKTPFLMLCFYWLASWAFPFKTCLEKVPPSCQTRRRGTNFTVRSSQVFIRLGKWHQGKALRLHLFFDLWDHCVIKDACMGKSVGNPTGWRLHRRQAWVRFCFS